MLSVKPDTAAGGVLATPPTDRTAGAVRGNAHGQMGAPRTSRMGAAAGTRRILGCLAGGSRSERTAPEVAGV